MLSNIPLELRLLPQWVCAGDDKIPVNPITKAQADVTNPSTWSTFENAVAAGYKHVGFVLSKNDPYCIIDLDNKPDRQLSQTEIDIHNRILAAFPSYIEKSANGLGFHIIIKGHLPKGRRRQSVEAYSSERYMICTGNVALNLPITDCQETLVQLVAEMTTTAEPTKLVQHNSEIPDSIIVEKASNASNGEKFDKLCNGDWQNDYQSQSEADFALMSIICFYTKDNEQCRRVFRTTQLGKRDKAQRDSYLDYALSKIRGNEPPPIDLTALIENAARMEEENRAKLELVEPIVEEEEYLFIPLENQDLQYQIPPGIVGELTKFFYGTAVRPAYEIALASALSIMAGITGRAYNISGTGLNHYIILLARTGSGKEGAAQGIEKLINATRPQIPSIDSFIGPAVFSSGQALIKMLGEKPCFVSVLGEFGLTLQQISHPRATSSEKTLKKVLLDLFNKSGKKDVLRGSVYSDTDKNTKAVQSPAVTIFGESTPESFFEGLDVSNIAEGLIPRFTIVEYTGKRPPMNDNPVSEPSMDLIKAFSNIVAQSLTLQNKLATIDVKISPEAELVLKAYCKYADKVMNSANNEVEMQLWNRAHLKALKTAAVLAVGLNYIEPIITLECANWAMRFIDQDIKSISHRFSIGDIGVGDSKQRADIKKIIATYKLDQKATSAYKVIPQMQRDYIIPLGYLSRRCLALTSFRNDRLGANRALSETIRNMVEQSMLVEIPIPQIKEKYGVDWKCYGVGSMFY